MRNPSERWRKNVKHPPEDLEYIPGCRSNEGTPGAADWISDLFQMIVKLKAGFLKSRLRLNGNSMDYPVWDSHASAGPSHPPISQHRINLLTISCLLRKKETSVRRSTFKQRLNTKIQLGWAMWLSQDSECGSSGMVCLPLLPKHSTAVMILWRNLLISLHLRVFINFTHICWEPATCHVSAISNIEKNTTRPKV